MQTLVDLVMTNTLILQCLNMFEHVMILNWSFSVTSPRNDIICMAFTIVISYLTLFHMLFLLFNVLTKYFSIYKEMLQDSKVIQTMWIFTIIASTLFVTLEFIFVHDIQSYKELKVLVKLQTVTI